MTSAWAVASVGMIPAIGEMNMQSRSSTPVTTEARPVRAPAATPALDSMKVVFEDADMKPPSMAAKPLMPRAVRIRGSRPSASSRPKWKDTPEPSQGWL